MTMRRESFQPRPPRSCFVRRDAAPSYYAVRDSRPVTSRVPRDDQIPVFAIILEFRGGFNQKIVSSKEVNVLISSCPTKPEKSVVIPNSTVPIGKLFFREWGKALDAYVHFWDRCLSGHPNSPPPKCFSNIYLQCDEEEREARLRELFVDHARGLLCGDVVNNVEKKISEVSAEMQKITGMLAEKNSVPAFLDLQARKDAILVERQQLVDRLEEFRVAMDELITWIKGSQQGHCVDGVFEVFEFGDVVDWQRVQMLMARECRRLEEGLPIYSFRRKILSEVFSNQVTVLIGETGSGKSTQFVQFLADSGLSANGSIVCTQPRKIAAVSLAQRVKEESHGCYLDSSVVSYATYSSCQRFNSTIIFMTDYCLLQHCMNDKSFAGISCIIVDEVHERSLNTDLLLALIKKQLLQRSDLRLVIMSATADADKMSEYFFGCQTIQVTGRNFPVEINYIPDVSLEASWINITKHIAGNSGSYVSNVVKMVSVIHKTEGKGAILAFLTAQAEVEWACENFQSPSAIVLPLHGKLSCEDQAHIFQSYAGKRKIIFSTNLSETSLTIPGVKFVVDCGMVKESRFEPGSGMNVLRVCRVSQSSAQQRAGRAGRTEPGKCYRLYSECEFQSMPPYQEPEIQKVHLGIAVLRIIALGIKNVKEFEFIDAPSFKAVDTAIQNLIWLGAVFCRDDGFELTDTGRKLVKLGIEPRLGKIILECINHGLVREGLVLSAVMTNVSSIFCRIGTDEDKQKADCLRIPFCHPDGDLFTLLSVYKEWERAEKNKNQWCWQNCINAKSLRRCRDTIQDIESCLRHELNTIVPSYWKWNPDESICTDLLKKAILSSLAENVAIYSGCEQLGYEVAQTGEHIQLHPSCSLHIYGQKPSWVVFGDILSTSNQYLVCVTAIDHEYLLRLQPPPLYDISQLENRMLKTMVLDGIGTHVLRRFCGKGNHNLLNIISRIKNLSKDPRSNVIVDFGKGAIYIFASLEDMEMASSVVNDALRYERKWLHNECIEKYLFHGGSSISPSIALWGSGAEIKHLELAKRSLTVEISHPNASTIEDKELLMLIDSSVPHMSGFCKHAYSGQQIGVTSNVWGTITFLTPEYSEEAIRKLDGVEFCGSSLGICSARSLKSDNKISPFHAVRVKLCWPRRRSKGVIFIKCALQDVEFIVQDFYNLVIGGRHVRCEASLKHQDCVIVGGIDKDISEREIFDVLRRTTKRHIIDFWLLRGDTVENLSTRACEEALRREIAPFMSCGQHTGGKCRIEVFNPEPKDFTMKAIITFDGSLHLEAAKALDHLQGKVLPGCQSWQKIECQHLFRSSVSCRRCIYFVIKDDLELVLKNFKRIRGGSYELDQNENGAIRIKLFADATKTIADMRKPLDLLMKGKVVSHTTLTPVMMDFLFTRDGVALMKSVERETGTCVIFDRHKLMLKVFGSCKNANVAEERLVLSLVSFHESKQLEIHFRSNQFPPNLMKEVVRRFGPNLRGLKEKVPGGEFLLNTRHQRLSLKGNKEMKQRVDKVISDVAKSLEKGRMEAVEQPSETACSICLCEPEEPYTLESCKHVFCYSCLVEQCESAIRTRDGFPLCCAREGCKAPILIVDLRFLLLNGRLEELFRASLSFFVTSSSGAYRFCPSPDCPSVYKVAGPNDTDEPFVCDACLMETCTKCHAEYHPFVSCELYKEYKEQPDLSLTDWMKGKENVKKCPVCEFTIEKIDGCNHISCRCGKHICWVCLETFESSDDCYNHLRNIHQSIS